MASFHGHEIMPMYTVLLSLYGISAVVMCYLNENIKVITYLCMDIFGIKLFIGLVFCLANRE